MSHSIHAGATAKHARRRGCVASHAQRACLRHRASPMLFHSGRIKATRSSAGIPPRAQHRRRPAVGPLDLVAGVVQGRLETIVRFEASADVQSARGADRQSPSESTHSGKNAWRVHLRAMCPCMRRGVGRAESALMAALVAQRVVIVKFCYHWAGAK